ncbi:MAG: M6 family metalloprotease domain-containing protein [Candidatus Eisenbacteria bacterium]|nr:M6 family metalloprotease domain-containing protein [Candidatus Eisenbacteria bacterium]
MLRLKIGCRIPAVLAAGVFLWSAAPGTFELALRITTGRTLVTAGAHAQIYPPAGGARPPEVYFETMRDDPTAYRFGHAWIELGKRVRANQQRIAEGLEPLSGETAVTGTRRVPVVAGKFANSSMEPFSPSQLEDQLFNGPNPTGTLTHFYNEISSGMVTLTGSVYGRQQADSLIQTQYNDTYYEGSCNGLGTGCSKTGDYLKELLDATDPWVDFSQYDNDGPDGIPNSGDDDGYVDFAAFVQPEPGAECSPVSNNIWSHRWVYSAWWGSPYSTDDQAFGGGFIKVEDYTIQPLLSCDGTSIIEIGVFAHEFGHAFGLPDLYDTDFTSNGIGRWGLMGYGSWGGDGQHPEAPVHMCAWSKEQLGWVSPVVAQSDQTGMTLPAVEGSGQVVKLVPNGFLQGQEYFLVEHRARTQYDQYLPADGLAVWHVDNTQSSNQNEMHKLVDLEEADGLDQLDSATSLGDAGDVYPGSSSNTVFDDMSYPNSRDYAGGASGIAANNISANASQGVFDLDVAWHFADATAGALGFTGNGQSVTWSDYDRDGDDDLYIGVYGSANRLLRNEGGGLFSDATAGPEGDAGNTQGVAWGDYDNDGDDDLYIANYNQANRLLRNDGGSFTDATAAPLGDASGGTAVAWADHDLDGDLDLYLANDNAPNKLFRNDGGGTFSDATTGPLGSNAFDTCATWGDYDNDGDPDLYLGIVIGANKLLRNDGGGTFADATGGPLADTGNTEGAAWGDYDNDGDLDLYLANGNPQNPNKLLRNDGGGSFADVTAGPLGDAGPGIGVAWLDFDLDGDLDLYLCNSGQANRLLRNDGGGQFTAIEFGVEADGSANRAVAAADYDRDGAPDLQMTAGLNQRLLRNVSAAGNHWLQVALIGTRSNASAIGARVELYAAGRRQVREIAAGSGHWSQDSRTLSFGLAGAAVADSIRVLWPSGTVQDTVPPGVDQRLTIVEPSPVAHVADHDVGNLVLSVTDQGILGFLDDSQSEGSGFIFPAAGSNVLYLGSLWVSQCETYVANRDFGADPEQEWEVAGSPDGHVAVDTLGVSDQDIRSAYRDTGGNDTRDLFVRQESWAWVNPPNDDFVIVRYFIHNEADTTQEDLYAGVLLDLDIDDRIDNTGDSDPQRQAIYMTDGSGLHAGLRLLDGDLMPDPRANMTFIHNPTYVWPEGYIAEEDKLGFLHGSDSGHSVPQAPEADDYSLLISAGPFSLAPGDSNEVAFAIIGGESLSDFLANAEQSQRIYLETVRSPAEAAEARRGAIREAALLPNLPNPFRRATQVRFRLARRAPVEIAVYDARGRRVRMLESGLLQAGTHSRIWDGRDHRGRSVASGVYFLRLGVGGRHDSRTVTVVR